MANNETPYIKALPQDNWEEKELRRWLREIPSRLVMGQFAWQPPTVSGQDAVDTAVTTATSALIGQVRAGMFVHVTPPSTLNVGLIPTAWVAADQELTIRISNITAAAISAASGTWTLWGMATT